MLLLIRMMINRTSYRADEDDEEEDNDDDDQKSFVGQIMMISASTSYRPEEYHMVVV